MWVDRIHIDEQACVHCGECVRACMKENPENPAMTNIAVNRIIEVSRSKGEIEEEPVLLQKLIRMSIQERRDFWDAQFRKCIKCYGCIEMCPVYLEPPESLRFERWIPKGEVPPPYPAFHLLRAYHVLDVCVLCGECELTCPVGIPLKTLQDITQYFPPEKVFELVPGLDEDIQKAIVEHFTGVRGQLRRMDYAV